ncbi:mitochondrial import receptor subunit TOM9-2-like [Brachypodium distachyon]|uniref:ABC transporter permease n=1 Tax=Brachypodium distachyon TaxID=15368 RepID=A0A2K2CPA6_BRADI|nr:mitochondrial import receptor subunit TOM9-2-like [Brachypodium distachyon]PNT63852.1 hypothetical protein BRADI_4g21741v3 [Brachypodium distachyon]|eukprot:XP_024310930.1 mitochondrial import receptor subunit TOM9-2-like [Brachypodium distachyon]
MALSTLSWPSSAAAADQGRKGAAVAWKLTRSTGKAMWIAVTTGLVLVLPLTLLVQGEADSIMLEDPSLAQRMAVLGV